MFIKINLLIIKNLKNETLEFDKVLVSVGRKPYTEGLNLSKVGELKKIKKEELK